MTTPDLTRPPGNTEARRLLLLALLGAGLVITVLLSKQSSAAILSIVYSLPLLLLLSLPIATRFLRLATATVPWLPAIVGVVYIAGGPVFDMVVTVVYSPDLTLEQNAIARLLLDSGHDLLVVYIYAIVAQSSLIGLYLLMWFALIRHRQILIESLNRPANVWHFIKAISGGAHLTWRQWFIPLRTAEFPCAYHYFWVCAVIVLAGASYRWYLGLEWLGLVWGLRVVVVTVTMIGSIVVYVAWIWMASRSAFNKYETPPESPREPR